jgi:hypothetical protein
VQRREARSLDRDEARLSLPLSALRRRQAVSRLPEDCQNCSVCGLDFTPHRADDLPAYLVIVIVGHIVVPAALWIETNYSPAVWLQLAIYPAVHFRFIACAAAAGQGRGGRLPVGVAHARL